MHGYPFGHEIRVRFAETDAQGIAHHASFVIWFEVARVAYLEAFAGGYSAIRERGLEVLTTQLDVRYYRAAYFDDRLTIWTRFRVRSKTICCPAMEPLGSVIVAGEPFT